MTTRAARSMSDDEISAELAELSAKWDDLAKDLEGHGGSPNEWLHERMDELHGERTRRLISLDGDIGRRHIR